MKSVSMSVCLSVSLSHSCCVETDKVIIKHFAVPASSGSLAKWLGRWTCDQQVASSNPSLSAVECNPGQVVNTYVPLSVSSIIWYQPMGGDALRLGR